MHRIAIVIPAFNEEKRLPPTLRSIKQWMDQANHPSIFIEEVIIVNDGSTDTTQSVCEAARSSLPLCIVSFPENRGKGSAVKAGIFKAQAEWILLLDADGATPIHELTKLTERQQQSGAPVVIGSRVLDPTIVSISRKRRIIGRLYHMLTSHLIPGIHDASCGFKLIRSDIAKDLFSQVRTNGYGYDVELLACVCKKRIPIEEVQVMWNAVDGSKVRLLRDGCSMLGCAILLTMNLSYKTTARTM